MEQIVRRAVLRTMSPQEDGPDSERRRVPLGLLMLAQGWITHPQMRYALDAQRANGTGRFGDWLTRECGVGDDQIMRGLSVQWKCPVLSGDGFVPRAMASFLPRVLIDAGGLLPVRLDGSGILHLASKYQLNPRLMHALERMTSMKLRNGLLPNSRFAAVQRALLDCGSQEAGVHSANGVDNLANKVAAAVRYYEPAASSIARVGDLFWLRMWTVHAPNCGAANYQDRLNGAVDQVFSLGGKPA